MDKNMRKKIIKWIKVTTAALVGVMLGTGLIFSTSKSWALPVGDEVLLEGKKIRSYKQKDLVLDNSLSVEIVSPEQHKHYEKGYLVVRANVKTDKEVKVVIALNKYKTLLEMKTNKGMYRRLMANLPDGDHYLRVYAFYDKIENDNKITRYYGRAAVKYRLNVQANWSFKRVWAPYLYLYGIGGIVFLFGVFMIRKYKAVDQESRKERWYFKLLFIGYAWFMAMHLFFNMIAIIFS